MIEQPALDWWAVAPEVLLGTAAIVVLLIGLIPRPVVRTLVPLLTLLAFAAAAGIAIMQFDQPRVGEWAGQIDADRMANIVRILAAGAGIITVLFSVYTRPRDNRNPEHYSLLLATVTGMGLFGAAGSLVTLFVGLELFSIALYILCALEAERVRSLEAGLKYLVVGGATSGLLLYGCALVYGATGTFDLSAIGEADTRGPLLLAGAALLLGGLAFKAAAVPMHWWAPDVYDGAPTSITAFMATATKVAAFVATARVLVIAFFPEADGWEPIVAALAAVSIIVGNLGALVQQGVKRMLAYSSVAHVGYLLIGVVAWEVTGLAALVYGLVAYVVMTLGAFAILMVRERQLGRSVTYDDLAGTGWTVFGGTGLTAVLPGLAMIVVMLSLAGIPPTAGFFAKFVLFEGAIQSDYAWLAVLGVLGSAVSLAYYLRVPVSMYLLQERVPTAEAATVRVPGGPEEELPVMESAAPTVEVHGDDYALPAEPHRRFPVLATLGVGLAAATLVLGLVPDRVMEPACDARRGFILQTDAPPACSPRGEVAQDDGMFFGS